MDDKSRLLEQLRIDRSAEDSARPGGGGPPWAWIVAALATLAVLAGAGWLWMRHQPHAGAVPVAAGSEVAADSAAGSQPAAGDGHPASTLDASGYVVARREATVSAKVTGRVVQVMIEEGQKVEAGQVVARLDDTNARAALDEARAQLEQARASLAAAQIAANDAGPIFQRNQKQRAAGVISAQDFDNDRATYNAVTADLDVKQRMVQVARAALEVAQRGEDDTIVRAPFSGVITVKAAQQGEIVSPMSTGGFTRTGIGTIVDMDSLEIEVDVSENFINRVHVGQQAVAHLNAYPDWEIPCEVVAIIPTADRSKATVKVRVGFKQKDPRILPEMGVRVSFLG